MTIATSSRTFTVSDVELATEPLPEIPYHQAIASFLRTDNVEACSQYHGRLVANVCSHPLIATLHTAFAEHRPVCLSPDMIWLTLMQGVAHHVNANAGQLRRHFVRHEGKLKIKVIRDDFVKGSPENPWPGVFGEFSAAIREHIGDAHGLIVSDFSTTGTVERAASEVVLLDAMQRFFSYGVHTLCGIPSITLEGTAEDWSNIARRMRALRQFDLDWWVDPLEPILEQFEAAAEGIVDQEFWQSIYKWNGRSGAQYVSGWVLHLFPYLDNPDARHSRFYGRPNRRPVYRLNRWLGSCGTQKGPGLDEFPGLPSKAPFQWMYRNEKVFDMEFVGGLIGMQQDLESLCLRPAIGWAVLDSSATRQKNTPG